MKTVTIFVASSAELAAERKALEAFLFQKSKLWVKERKIFLEMKNWEDFIDAVSKTRLQSEYNACIKSCDVFLMMYWSKVGKYTREEFETALTQFQVTSKPLLYVYFRNTLPATADTESLDAFNKRLNEIGHFKTIFNSTSELILHFNNQLDKLVVEERLDTEDNKGKSKQKNEILAMINASNYGDAFEELNKIFMGNNAILNSMIFDFTSNPVINMAMLAMKMKTFVATNL